MRRVLVILTGLLILSGLMLAGVPLTAQDAKMADAGKKLFTSKDCIKCHMIAGKGNKIGKLDGIASKIDVETMKQWLTSPAEMKKKLEKQPKVKMSSKIKQMALKPEDITSLLAYLSTLK